MPKIKPVIIELTQEQIEKLKPIVLKVEAGQRMFSPGMALGQIVIEDNKGALVCGFVRNEEAQKIQEIMRPATPYLSYPAVFKRLGL